MSWYIDCMRSSPYLMTRSIRQRFALGPPRMHLTPGTSSTSNQDLTCDYNHTTPKMPVIRASRLISTPRARLQIITRPQRTLSSTPARASDSHGPHLDPPGGWLWGVKPGEKPEKEGWENIWFYGFWGTMLFGVVGYAFKPDSR